jgi:hypothetical protein
MSRTTRAAQVPGAPTDETTGTQPDTAPATVESGPLEDSFGPVAGEQAAFAEQPVAAPGVLRAADVDPTRIKRAVLTADGWVCPATTPAPAARS